MRNLLALTIIGVGLMSCSPQVNYESIRPVPSPGPKGDTGERGPAGPGGIDGSSCSIVQLVNGVRISCTDGTEAVVLNGTNGIDGAAGQNGADAPPTMYSVVEVIDVCGKQAAFDEVLLKLANGQIMAHFASGSQQFLALIGPGNYTTTDNTSCKFTVTNSGDIINEHN